MDSGQLQSAGADVERIRTRKECALTIAGIGVSAGAFAMACVNYAGILADVSAGFGLKIELIVFVVIAGALLYGNFVYQLCRISYWRRRSSHSPAARHQLETLYDETPPSVTILIPSYREESHVLGQTIMSAALAEYPSRRVVVLIDDPPQGTGAERHALEETRKTVEILRRRIAVHAARIEIALRALRERVKIGHADRSEEAKTLASLYEASAEWLDAVAREYAAKSTPAFEHGDRLFIEKMLLMPSSAHRERAARLRRVPPNGALMAREYVRLGSLFKVEIASFERKQFENLSHQPNKAMNLNAYIGLMGRNFRIVETGLMRRELSEHEWSEAQLRIPATDYVLTLDADSVIQHDYIMRLVSVTESDSRVAVAQTPYSAVPGAASCLERAAGATTDIQYLVHQGFTGYGATYWVGANALLRLSALRDVQRQIIERGYRVPIFIQDRTVIEDTGSTVDLIRRGWTLYNYPERLAYSATPSDFGSLIIQRRRWSNGGLIILPDLLRYARSLSSPIARTTELLMRAYYLVSPALANFGLLAILLYPFDISLSSVWLPLSAAPYYFFYARDLRHCGYRWSDLARVYALNLLLMPVNLAGVVRSLQQAITGRKTAFGRTPKIEGRTATPAFYLLIESSIFGFLLIMLVVDFTAHRYSHAAFSLVNAAFWAYGLWAFIGLREAQADARMTIAGRWSTRRDIRAQARSGAFRDTELTAIPALSPSPQPASRAQ